MSGPEILLTIIIVLALGLIITEKLRADVVALMILVALSITNIVTPDQAISGFSRSAVITIMGLFIISAALDRSGVTNLLANGLLRISGNSEIKLVSLFMLSGAALSLFMNNIAAGAVLLPAAINVARRTNIPASKILMPLSFGTLLGGMATFFTTANIIVATSLKDHGLPTLGILDFTPTGGVVLIAGVIYMILIGRRLLPVRSPAGQYSVMAKTTEELEQAYQLQERLWETVILPGSPLVGKTLTESGIGERLGLTVLAIWHNHQANLSPLPEDMFYTNDILLIAGREDRVSQLKAQGLRIGRGESDYSALTGPRVTLIEAIVAPRSEAEGRTLKDLNFRKKYGITAVALWRDGRSFRTDVGLFELRFGDALLMVGPTDRLKVLQSEPNFIILNSTNGSSFDRRRTLLSVGITIFVLAIATLGVVSIPVAMFLGAILMVLTGCLSMDDSYRAIEWRTIFLLAGMLPVSIAMNQTGLAQHLGDLLVTSLQGLGPLAVMGGLYVLTVLLGQVMGGQVTALVLAPIAISAATRMGSSPQAACVAVAIGCSTSFLTPIAHPVNVLMMGPAGYTFRDFFRVGRGLTVVCFFALLVALPLFWKL